MTVLSVALGVYLRLSDPGKQIFWHDEVHTALRIFGFSTQELESQVFDSRLHTAKELQTFQHPDPEKKFTDTLKSLAGHPEHGPLYYLMARIVAPWFKPPLVGARVLTGLIGILLLIAIYYLARHLFPDDPLSPWISVTLVSLSPFFILYSREARQYSLWALITAICMIWFLKLKSNTRNWFGFGMLMALGLYTHLMFAWLILAFILYILFEPSYRKYWRNLGKSIIAAVILFSFWIWVVVLGIRRVNSYTSWMKNPLKPEVLIGKWALNLHYLLFDLPNLPWIEIISIPVFIGAFIWTMWRGYRKAAVLLALVMATNVLPLVIPDLVSGGMRSVGARYMMSAWLCLELCLAFLISFALAGNIRSRIIGYVFLVSVFIGTASFGYQYLQSDTWWNKFSSYFNPMAARLINESRNPLIVTDSNIVNPGEVLSLSYLVKPQTPFLLVNVNEKFDLPAGYDLFVLNPSWKLLDILKHRCVLKRAAIPGAPWWLSEKK